MTISKFLGLYLEMDKWKIKMMMMMSPDLVLSMCIFQERLLLINKPRNFVSFTILICLS
jgi:hypothetical protein